MTTLPGVDAAPRDASKSQWYTPPELAERIVEWSLYDCDTSRRRRLLCDAFTVIEPSCGDGALVAHLLTYGCDVVGIDIDAANIARCEERFGVGRAEFFCDDFLTMQPIGKADLVVMNPPFENGQTEAHILQALKWSDRVACHCPLTTLEGKARKASLWSKVSLTRMVIHSTRPKYGGGKAGATAMCTVEVVPELQDGCKTAIEWW